MNIKEAIKNHFEILVTIPVVLGSLWQVVELSLISPAYVRFFSAGQLLADGALILLLVIIFYFLVQLLVFYLNYGKSAKDVAVTVTDYPLLNIICLIVPLFCLCFFFLS